MSPHAWDHRFLFLADHVASWSKDPSTKVGAVIVRPDRTVVSLGYNGFPRKVRDTAERYEDRETKLRMVVHAEANAILTARQSLYGCTLYVSGLHPCATCSGMIIQAGIREVVTWRQDVPERWLRDREIMGEMFAEAGVLFHERSLPR